MLFNSLPFLFGFLPVVYFVFWRLRSRQARYIWLTLSGYVFYGFWDYRFCALMAASTAISYLAGRGILAHPERKRIYVWAAVASDLAILGFFNYTGFAFRSANGLAHLLGWDVTLPAWDIVLPVGISFRHLSHHHLHRRRVSRSDRPRQRTSLGAEFSPRTCRCLLSAAGDIRSQL